MANEMVSAHQIVVLDCPIAKLADEDLAAIFKHLPPFERLIVSAVCLKWRDLSKTPWRDITHLDLSQVPSQNIHAVITKCTNIVSVSTRRQNLGDLGRFASRLHNVTALKCADCAFAVQNSTITPYDGVDVCLRSAPLSELVWHNFGLNLMHPVCQVALLFQLPATLKRLQLSGYPSCNAEQFVELRLNVSQLESLIVSFPNLRYRSDPPLLFYWAWIFDADLLHASENLREVYLNWANPDAFEFGDLADALPRLEILFLHNGDFEEARLKKLLLTHPNLRVIVLTASLVPQFVGEHVIPTRSLYPDGFNADPVPPMHLFLGKIASERLRFEPSPAYALTIYPIDAPLPEFLEKEVVKPIFERSWIASRIKEGVREAVNLADYSFEGPTTSILYAQ